jgi:hypothetical protein
VPPKAEHASAGISAQPPALLQNTEPPCKEELLIGILLLLLKTPKGEEEEETPASEEELLAEQDATIVPPKKMHASAEISAQPPALLQNTKAPGKKELLLSAFPKISSADSMSEEQENSKPIAATGNAKNKSLFMRPSRC